MKLRWTFIALILLSMVLVGLPWARAMPLMSPQSNDITCTASLGSIYQDEEETDVTVHLSNLSGDLYGYQLIVNFEATKLQAQASGTVFGDIITCGTNGCYDVWDAVIDNTAGTVKFARTQQNPGGPATADGSLAVVRFKAKSDAGTGTTPITLTDVKLADRDGNQLAVDSQSCTSIEIKGKGFVQGTVDLQGRPDPGSVSDDSGATLTIDTDAITPGVQPPDLYPAAGIQSSAAGAWGSQKAAAGTYTAEIDATKARYLDYRCSTSLTINPNGATIILNALTMKGGDANDDNIIDVGDASILGGEFGKSPPDDASADINNDNTVDIFDLVLMGGNYDLKNTTSPGDPLEWVCQ